MHCLVLEFDSYRWPRVNSWMGLRDRDAEGGWSKPGVYCLYEELGTVDPLYLFVLSFYVLPLYFA